MLGPDIGLFLLIHANNLNSSEESFSTHATRGIPIGVAFSFSSTNNVFIDLEERDLGRPEHNLLNTLWGITEVSFKQNGQVSP